MLVVDTSGNLIDDRGYRSWEALKDFLYEIIDSLELGPGYARVGMVTFGGEPRVNFHLDECNQASCMKDKINAINPVSTVCFSIIYKNKP